MISHSGGVELVSQTGSALARLAENEYRLLSSFETSDEVGRLRLREFLSRRHMEVDMGDAKLFGLSNLRVVPRRTAALSAQIDDRLDAVGLLVSGDVECRRLC